MVHEELQWQKGTKVYLCPLDPSIEKTEPPRSSLGREWKLAECRKIYFGSAAIDSAICLNRVLGRISRAQPEPCVPRELNPRLDSSPIPIVVGPPCRCPYAQKSWTWNSVSYTNLLATNLPSPSRSERFPVGLHNKYLRPNVVHHKSVHRSRHLRNVDV